MNRDDGILLAAAKIRLNRAARRAALAFDRLSVASDEGRAGREVEKLIASARDETPASDEVLREGPSEDARRYARRRRLDRHDGQQRG